MVVDPLRLADEAAQGDTASLDTNVIVVSCTINWTHNFLLHMNVHDTTASVEVPFDSQCRKLNGKFEVIAMLLTPSKHFFDDKKWRGARLFIDNEVEPMDLGPVQNVEPVISASRFSKRPSKLRLEVFVTATPPLHTPRRGCF